MNARKQIGFDRRLELDWLEQAAKLTVEEKGSDYVRRNLLTFLDGKVAGCDRTDSACGKAVRLLSRIWLNVYPDVVDLRDRSIEVFPQISVKERLVLHWALCLAGFRFFGDVASYAGRLLHLQGSFTTFQIMRRLQEEWGERSTLKFASQRALSSMVNWGTLGHTEDQGVYTNVAEETVADEILAEILLEGLLIYEGKAVTISQARNHPALFPFNVSLSLAQIRESAVFEVHRQGLDMDVIQLVADNR